MTDTDKIVRAIESLAKTMPRTAQRGPEQLSSAEVEELRSLLAHTDDIRAFCSSRALKPDGARDERLNGLWSELLDMRLILGARDMGGAVAVIGVTSRGSWAVELHDARQMESAREEKWRNRHDWLIAIATGVSGFVGVIAGCVLTWALNACGA